MCMLCVYIAMDGQPLHKKMKFEGEIDIVLANQLASYIPTTATSQTAATTSFSIGNHCGIFNRSK